MKQNETIKGEVPKPRSKVYEVLRNKVGGAHEPKVGDNAKQARQKEQIRKEIETSQ